MRHLPRTLTRAAACCAGAGLLVLLPTNAFAGDLNTWSNLSNVSALQIPNDAQPTIVRSGNSLRVVWFQDSGVSTAHRFGWNIYRSAVVGSLGATSESASTIFGATQLEHSPRLVRDKGGQHLAMTGYDNARGLDGKAYALDYRSSGPWALGAALSQTTSASSNLGMDAISGPQPVGGIVGGPIAWASVLMANPQDMVWNTGDPSDSALSGSLVTDFPADPRYPALARDLKSGEVWTVFQDINGHESLRGYNAFRVDNGAGAPDTAITNLGGPCTRTPSVACTLEKQRAGLAARVGGGVYLIRGEDSPGDRDDLVVQRLGTTSKVRVGSYSRSASHAEALAQTGGGRLWAVWADGDTVYAARSNPTVTRFGAPTVLPAPSGMSVCHIAADSTAIGRLDIVITASPQGCGDYPYRYGPTNVYHRQALPALTVASSGRLFSSGGTLSFTVSDAGKRLAGASVTLAGKSAVTDINGYTKLNIGFSLVKGKKYPVTVALSGYATKTIYVAVA